MSLPPCRALASLFIAHLICGGVSAQQQAAQLPAVGQQQPLGAEQPPVQAPPGFQLNALQQARLDQILDAWQAASGNISTFKCSFERWEYNVAFGPAPNIPLNKEKGEVSFQRPDKGSFQITQINVYQAQANAPGQPANAQPQDNWVPQPNAVGEHWVCDGKSIFEYRHNQKQLVERPIPPHLQGQAIIDAPLPFLFGANAAQLKQRYWIRVQEETQNQIWLVAIPRFQEQAAEFKEVEVMLDRQQQPPKQLLPRAMQVHLPNGSKQLYMFDIANASVNNKLAQLQALFMRPHTPIGYKRVVEPMPINQAAQPVQPAR